MPDEAANRGVGFSKAMREEAYGWLGTVRVCAKLAPDGPALISLLE